MGEVQELKREICTVRREQRRQQSLAPQRTQFCLLKETSQELKQTAPQEQAGTTRGLMAARTLTVEWQGWQYHGHHRRLVPPYLSLSLRYRYRQSHRQEEEHGPSDSELYQ